MKATSLFVIGAALGGLLVGTAPARAQSSAFTYQGRLNGSGVPANGSYDLTFALFNTSSGPGQVGATLTNLATAVANGLFTVTLDFGNQFPGADRWLELSVRTNGSGTWTSLSPRQRLTSAPYAIFAAGAATAASANAVAAAGINGVLAPAQIPNLDAAKIATGTLADTRLSANVALLNGANVFSGANRFAGALVATNANNLFRGSFTGNGAGLTSLNASQLASGTVPPATLPGIVVTNGATGVTIGGTFSGSGVGLTNVDVRTLLQHELPVAVWGDNTYGQTDMPLLSNIVAIAGGLLHSLVLKTDGKVLAWGDNTYGQSAIPVGLSNVTALAGGFAHSLALKSDGKVTAWGDNTYLQSDVPVGLSNVTAIAAGIGHSLALKNNGTLVPWGDNTYGQQDIPVGVSNVVAIAAGANHCLALKTGGTVAAWGNNDNGQTDIPIGLSNVVAVAAGGNHSLALTSDGLVTVWGANAYNQTLVPVGLSNVMAVAAGYFHSLALRSNGTVTAWGRSDIGQTAVPIGLTNVRAIAGGGYHNLALRPEWNPALPALLTENAVFQNAVSAVSFSGYPHVILNPAGGNVGIGTTTPTNRLHVIGGATFTSGDVGLNQNVVWTPGGAGWSFTSDRNVKERIEPVNPQAVLESLAQIPIAQWSYIGYDQRHIGPMAQDFHAQFPLNEDNTSLNDADLHGVALAAIQGLNQKLEARSRKLEAENAELKARLQKLEQLLLERRDAGAK